MHLKDLKYLVQFLIPKSDFRREVIREIIKKEKWKAAKEAKNKEVEEKES